MSEHGSKLPKSGGWIMIRTTIGVAAPIPPLSFWFAKPSGRLFLDSEREKDHSEAYEEFIDELRYFNRGADIGRIDDFKLWIDRFQMTGKHHKRCPDMKQPFVEKWAEAIGVDHQATIITPDAEVKIQPEEYSVVIDMTAYYDAIKEDDAEIIWLNKSKSLKGKIKDQVFYMQCRGIPYGTALPMCIGSMKSSMFFYVRMRYEIVNMFFRGLAEWTESHKYDWSSTDK